jgi:hypothetical protein
MKKLIVSFVIAMVAIVGIPSLGMANTNPGANLIQGGSFATYRVPQNTINTHQVYLYPGHLHVSISGDGDTDLDLYVYDSYGNHIFSGTSYSDDEAACFKVLWAGNFTVKVQNRGRVYNDYRMTIEYK